MSSIYLLLFVILPFLLAETARSVRNERWLRAQGAVEPPDDPHRFMAIVYPGTFLLMALEGWWRGGAREPWLLAGLLLFTAGKLLKFYAIATLGRRWCFRVLPLPQAPLIAAGPYRWFRHPNYIGLAGEILGAAAMMYAPVAGLVGGGLFALLVAKRIAVEERALGIQTDRPGRTGAAG